MTIPISVSPIVHMGRGIERRRYILSYLKEHGRMPVNSRGCPMTKSDGDIKTLIKKGLIKTVRFRHYSYFHRVFGQTYVVLVDYKE